MEQYCECLVKRRVPGRRKLLHLVVGVFFCLALAGSFFVSVWILPAAVLLGAWEWILIRNAQVEFEYLLVNGEFSVDCIYHKARRKHKASFPVQQFMLVAPVDSAQLSSFRREAGRVEDFSSGAGTEKQYAILVRGQKMAEIRITPSATMLAMLEQMLSLGTVCR